MIEDQTLMQRRFEVLQQREAAAHDAALDLIAAPKRYRELGGAKQRAVLNRLTGYLKDPATMPADVGAALDKQWPDGETALSFARAHTPRQPAQFAAPVLAQEDEDALWLQIELANDCAITIRTSKHGEPSSVAVWSGSGEHTIEMDQAAGFAEWLRVALAGATPYQARMFGGDGIALRRHCT